MTVGDLKVGHEIVQPFKFLFVEIDVFPGQVVHVAFRRHHHVVIDADTASDDIPGVVSRMRYVSIHSGRPLCLFVT